MGFLPLGSDCDFTAGIFLLGGLTLLLGFPHSKVQIATPLWDSPPLRVNASNLSISDTLTSGLYHSHDLAEGIFPTRNDL